MNAWKQILKTNLKTIQSAVEYFALTKDQINALDCTPGFPLNIPLRIAKKIEKSCINDPLFLQYVPLKTGSDTRFSLDPVMDRSFAKSPRLLQKYHARALFLVTSACAMHCRYCFRQNYPYEKTDKTFEKELTFIRNDPDIHEVILSGGDPLSLDDRYLGFILDELEKIPHVSLVRFHSKLIMGIPERITDEFLSLLKNRRFQIVFIVHVNHPKELDEEILHQLKEIQLLGIPTLSQSVLLNHVNCDVTTLIHLFETLIQWGIIPYYLHELDRVKGAEYFFVEREKALSIMQELRNHLPGYAVPRFVVEIPHEPAKTILF